jgi:putative chitinase
MAPHITPDSLARLAPSIRPDRAVVYAAALEAAREIAHLDRPLRVAHFLAQIAYESAGFGGLVESVRHSDPDFLLERFPNIGTRRDAVQLITAGPAAIANRIYANLGGNGDESSGDGYRYRGRGLILVIGRAAYQEVEDYSGLPVSSSPGLLGAPRHAAHAVASFWATRAINLAADADDVAAVTQAVAGPTLAGLEGRRAWLDRARTVLS